MAKHFFPSLLFLFCPSYTFLREAKAVHMVRGKPPLWLLPLEPLPWARHVTPMVSALYSQPDLPINQKEP